MYVDTCTRSLPARAAQIIPQVEGVSDVLTAKDLSRWSEQYPLLVHMFLSFNTNPALLGFGLLGSLSSH